LFFEQKVKFLYPPTSLLFLEPLRLPYRGGVVPDDVLNATSWIGVLAIAVIIGRIFWLNLGPKIDAPPGEKYLLIAAAFLTPIVFYPLQKAYVIGQIQTWIDLLAAAMLLAWMRRKEAPAGVFSGLICLIKPQLALFLV